MHPEAVGCACFEDWLTGTSVYVNLVDAATSTVLASASVAIGNGAFKVELH